MRSGEKNVSKARPSKAFFDIITYKQSIQKGMLLNKEENAAPSSISRWGCRLFAIST
jgi:hypothetical protein